MEKNKETFNNLIDFCIILEENPEFTGNTPEMFRYLLENYFFKQEVNHSKSIEHIFNDFKVPEFLNGMKSLFEISLDDIKSYINGTMINDSLAGRVMFTPQYLKVYYPHHTPSFNKLPEDVRFELIDRIKEKNKTVINAFEKLFSDREADKKRKVITLIALILKNICKKTGRPLVHLTISVDEAIKKIFKNTDEIFNGSQRQSADLGDDLKIKELIKTFFQVRKFNEINELAAVYREELLRYRKRGIKIDTN